MKKTYQPPQIEVIALSTEQGVLEVSNGILTLLATGNPSSGIEPLEGWSTEPKESWE